MSKLVGRKSIDLNINDLKDGHIPVYDKDRGLWTTINPTGSLSASYATNAETLDGLDSTVFATTGSNVFLGDQILSGSQILTGSLIISGTMQINNTIQGSIVTALSASYIDGGYY